MSRTETSHFLSFGVETRRDSILREHFQDSAEKSIQVLIHLRSFLLVERLKPTRILIEQIVWILIFKKDEKASTVDDDLKKQLKRTNLTNRKVHFWSLRFTEKITFTPAGESVRDYVARVLRVIKIEHGYWSSVPLDRYLCANFRTRFTRYPQATKRVCNTPRLCYTRL